MVAVAQEAEAVSMSREAKKLRRCLRLGEGDHIVSAYAQPAAGPGWSNAPLWVVVRDGNGKLREECLQPEEQPRGVLTLYRIASAVHGQLLAEITRVMIS